MLNLHEINIRKGDFTITLRAGEGENLSTKVLEKPAMHAETKTEKPAGKTSEPNPVSTAPEKKADSPKASTYSKTINAPFVGTFYTTGGPGKPKFTEEGKTVKAGETVCIVEAMKLFNEIKAPVNCKIIKFLLAEGQSVQKDQPLIAIEAI
jgi:acetyl-CoA carboxylase biotin carboxyl carrier protein